MRGQVAEAGTKLLYAPAGIPLVKYTHAGKREERVMRLTKKRDIMWTKKGKQAGGTTLKAHNRARPYPVV